MHLWRVEHDRLGIVPASRLDQERRLEDWIYRDPAILGMELAIIGRQVYTEHGGIIDLLAIDNQANTLIIELKKGRTPREIIAQVLDYASWVSQLDYDDLDQIAQSKQRKSLPTIYNEAFDDSLPDAVNTSHNMVIVASELDDSSERIINYLSEQHDLSINAVFFNVFEADGNEFLGRAWLRDPMETVEKSVSKKRPPWTGYWFVNVGEGEHRNWDDNRKYGYVGAGQGEIYSRGLQKLRVGDRIFAYLKGLGYVGYGEIDKPAQPISQFEVESHGGKTLLELPLQAPNAGENADNPDLCEWAVGVNWMKTFDREGARTFKGAFANPNVVCKLRDPETLKFLQTEFGID